jgi:molybdopterin/thiamine biosynthesis adenylyltransferase
MNSKIAFLGIGGVGLEVAKNLVLKALNIDIFDSRVILNEDLDEFFLFSDEDVGKTR